MKNMTDKEKAEFKLGCVELGLSLCSGLAMTDIFKSVVKNIPTKDGLVHKIGRAAIYVGVFSAGCKVLDGPFRMAEKIVMDRVSKNLDESVCDAETVEDDIYENSEEEE